MGHENGVYVLILK